MANELDGLFGPTPQQIQQQQYLAQRQFAMDTAKMNSLDLAKYGAGMAGAGVGGLLAPALGIQNPAMQQAKMQEQIMSSGDTDLTTSKGMLAKADEFRKAGDLRTAMALTLKGKELEKQEAAAALAARKQDFQENEALQLKRDQLAQAAELKKMQLEQAVEAAQLRSEDRRYSADQRAEAARYAADNRLQIAQLMAEMKRLGIEAKSGTNRALTQAGKLRQDLEAGNIDQSTYDAEIAALPGGKIQATKEAAATGALSHLDNIERNLDKLYDDKTGKLKEPATSLFGSKLNQFRGSMTLTQPSVDALTSLTALKDQVMLSNLQEAKARVGQSFGSMQLKEWDKFVNQLASLDRAQSEESAAANMKDIKTFIRTKRPILEAALGGKVPAGAEPTTPAALSAVDRQALQWANANPSDPRAVKIKQRLGQ